MHHSCSLANKVENIDCRQVWSWPLKVRLCRLPSNLWCIFGPHKSLVQLFNSAVSAHGCDQLTDLQTYRPSYIGNNRPHLMLCIAVQPNNITPDITLFMSVEKFATFLNWLSAWSSHAICSKFSLIWFVVTWFLSYYCHLSWYMNLQVC